MEPTQEFQQRIGRIEKLVEKLESSPDKALQSTARDLVQSLMDLYGAGLERILEIVSSSGGDAGVHLLESLGHDDLVSSLLVLHGLHPEDFETRVRRGIEKVRPFVRSRGAGLDVVDITSDTIRLKITGAWSADIEEAVRSALLDTAPDAAEVAIEGSVGKKRTPGFVPLTSLLPANASPLAVAESSRS